MRVIIIGGVAAGAAAATRLKREKANWDITIFEKSSKISFSNCGLPYGLSDEVNPSSLAPSNFDKMESLGIKVHVFSEAIKINEKNKTVEVKNLSTNTVSIHPYDKLIVATGARAIDLPIEGLKEEENVFSLRTYDDMNQIIKKTSKMKTALVIGAGFIGIEVAENLRKKGLNVYLVEMKKKVAGFDFDFSSFIEEHLRQNGINLLLGKEVSQIDSKLKKFTVNEEQYDYDFIIKTGITPNSEIFNDTSIDVDEKRLIDTNDNMQTSNKDIYAVGDITYSKHVFTKKNIYMPMARQANQQGRIAADHIASIAHQGKMETTGAMGFVLFDQIFAKVGLTENATKFLNIDHRIVMSTSNAVASYISDEKIVMKMIFSEKDNKLIGLQAMGRNADKAVDAFAVALTAGMTIYDLEKINLLYQPKLSTTTNPLNLIAQVAINEIKFGFSSVCPGAINSNEEDVKVIDTRSNSQHINKGHLENAINISTNKLSKESVGEDLNQNIVVHCNSGFGSAMAARKLVEMGYKNVRNAYGGNIIYQLMKKKMD